jgi:phosphoribosyl 1,2-cyclic phosphodiesterase
MSLHLASLNSGSNGNCYYIGNDRDALLIDSGISCRETERRMKRLGLAIQKVRAIFITHEHTDHTRGTEVLSRKHRIPVYITEKTRQHGNLWLEPELIRDFSAHKPVPAGSLMIHAVPKHHDGIDPHSFTVVSGGLVAGVFTDIGAPCKNVVNHFGKCHAAFLESNYDEKMLTEGRYPVHLKRRIRGDKGHLSNDQSLELFLSHRSPQLELLVLSHLSAENNKPEIVRELFAPHANGTRIEVASRYNESELFVVGGNKKPGRTRVNQLSLF